MDPVATGMAASLAHRVEEVLQRLLAEPLAPGLYIVSTPIGNLADISLRALAVLARAQMILAEDTRHSRKLLAHYGLSATNLSPFHEHNEDRERPRILARLKAGLSIALICDAGTPLVSDPGFKLVRDARAAGLPVTSVPGASALLAALTGAGVASDRFFFEGFLPPRGSARRRRLEALAAVPAALVFYEAPQRLAQSLADMAAVLGSREAAVARELTKLHEMVVNAPLAELARRFAGETVRGEIVIVVAPPETSDVAEATIREALAQALGHASLRDAVRTVAERLGVPRSRVYRMGLDMTKGEDG